MPHITIEYSQNVSDHHDIKALVDAVHAAGIDHGLAPIAGLRTRAAERQQYRVADGEPDRAFIAIHARIGPGRDGDHKRSFLEALLTAAEASIDAATEQVPLTIAWSAELTELDPNLRINHNHIRSAMENS